MIAYNQQDKQSKSKSVKCPEDGELPPGRKDPEEGLAVF